VNIPRIASGYANVYKPGSDVFPGPNAANLIVYMAYRNYKEPFRRSGQRCGCLLARWPAGVPVFARRLFPVGQA
jgi:hypothetical protein